MVPERIDEAGEDVGGVGGGGGEVDGLLPGGFVGGEREEVGLEGVGDLLADVAEDERADDGGRVLEKGDDVEGDGGGGGEGGADGFFPGGGGVG